MNPLRWKLHWQILLSLGLAFGLAVAARLSAAEGALPSWSLLLRDSGEWVGKLFLNLLRMVTLPLIFCTITAGVMRLGGGRDFGRLGLKTLLYYSGTGLAAILLALLLFNLINPGLMPGSAEALGSGPASEKVSGALKSVGGSGDTGLAAMVLRMVPANPFKSLVENDLIGVIIFALCFGLAAGRLPAPRAATQLAFWDSANEALEKLTAAIIRLTPVGIFGLVFSSALEAEPSKFVLLGKFTLTVVLGLAIHLFILLPLSLLLFARENPLRHFRALAPAFLTAFSTASSTATLPVTLRCVRENVGVSEKVSGFTIPLGATVNMNGTALYECVVVLFLAQLFHFPLGLGEQFGVALMALLTSVGVAGIPQASLVAIILILNNVGFPQEQAAAGLSLVLVVDRLLDMARTTVNVAGDTFAAVVVGKSEGESGYYQAGDSGDTGS